MFTGIVEEIGTVLEISSDKITINCSKVLNETKVGDSISVNGVCLTVTSIGKNFFKADVSQETSKITTLSALKNNSEVNLERALTLSARLGGHIVSGHIDTIGKISKVSKLSDFYELTISFDSEYNKYVVRKGSITVDGISLTIADCESGCVTIAVIPHTYSNTVLKNLSVGDKINIEFDILAKYVEKNLYSRDNSNITNNFLAENGFV
ncbi:riboflavin synthase [bacterium]|nr:riboflavin synthase [bacterium]